MEIPDFVAAVTKVKQAKIKRYASHVNRASGIGYAMETLDGCMRRGVYDRTHSDQKELHDVRGQFIFDEGHNQEAQILRDLDLAGVKIIKQQTPFSMKDKRPGKEHKILLEGTIEGKIELGEEAGHATEELTFEIKSMNPNIFTQMNTFEDFRKKPWTLAYMAQMMSYMLGVGEERGLFILKDKSNGTLKQIEVPIDYDLAEEVLHTAEQINDHVDAGTLPERRNDVDKCVRCAHKAYCLPDIDFKVGPAVANDPDLENKIDRWMVVGEHKKEEKDLNDSIKAKCKVSATQNGGKIDITLGKYRITGKITASGSISKKIMLIEEGKADDADKKYGNV